MGVERIVVIHLLHLAVLLMRPVHELLLLDRSREGVDRVGGEGVVAEVSQRLRALHLAPSGLGVRIGGGRRRHERIAELVALMMMLLLMMIMMFAALPPRIGRLRVEVAHRGHGLSARALKVLPLGGIGLLLLMLMMAAAVVLAE